MDFRLIFFLCGIDDVAGTSCKLLRRHLFIIPPSQLLQLYTIHLPCSIATPLHTRHPPTMLLNLNRIYILYIDNKSRINQHLYFNWYFIHTFKYMNFRNDLFYYFIFFNLVKWLRNAIWKDKNKILFMKHHY